MVPDISTRLAVMKRSLREVIIPAIDPERKLALEQANMLIGYLEMLGDQHDRQLHLDLAELRDYCGYTRELLELAGTTADSREARELLLQAEPLEGLRLPTAQALRTLLRGLKSSADALLRGLLDQHGERRAAAQSLALRQAERQLLRERAWIVKGGFELEPDKLPSIDSLLAD